MAHDIFLETVSILKLLKPIIDVIYKQPLKVQGENTDSVAVKNGFAETFRLADKILPEVSPELYKKYQQLQRDGLFEINLNKINNASANEININISNNPTDIKIIAHEVAHTMVPQTGHILCETPSITAEILAHEALQRYGIDSNILLERTESINTFTTKAKYAISLLEIVEELGQDLSTPETKKEEVGQIMLRCYQHGLDIFHTVDKIQTNKGYILRSMVGESFETLKHTYSRSSHTKTALGFVVGSAVDYHDIGFILSILLSQKIKNDKFTLNEMFDTLNNNKLNCIEKLSQLGITEITPEMTNSVYEYASGKEIQDTSQLSQY